jgi:hypothetical protein
LGDLVFQTAPNRRFCELCRVRPLHEIRAHFRAWQFRLRPFDVV